MAESLRPELFVMASRVESRSIGLTIETASLFPVCEPVMADTGVSGTRMIFDFASAIVRGGGEKDGKEMRKSVG